LVMFAILSLLANLYKSASGSQQQLAEMY
jgi:hypothetical protein